AEIELVPGAAACTRPDSSTVATSRFEAAHVKATPGTAVPSASRATASSRTERPTTMTSAAAVRALRGRPVSSCAELEAEVQARRRTFGRRRAPRQPLSCGMVLSRSGRPLPVSPPFGAGPSEPRPGRAAVSPDSASGERSVVMRGTDDRLRGGQARPNWNGSRTAGCGLLLVLTLAALGGLAACSDSTSPADPPEVLGDPTVVATLDVPGGASGVVVRGALAYVRQGSGASTLAVVDVADPTSPVVLGSLGA